MSYTIKTTYLRPSNTLGARIRAVSPMAEVTLAYPYWLDGSDCHRYVAKHLIIEHTHVIPDGSGDSHSRGYVFTVSMVG